MDGTRLAYGRPVTTAAELDSLSPTPLEVVLAVLVLLHVVLIVVLIALVVLDRVRVPRGGIWVAILFLVPVAGPLMVLLRGHHDPAR